MSVDAELRDQIITSAPLVNGRVYPIIIPQNAVFPCARYNRVSVLRDYTLSGPDCLPAVRFQVDVFGSSFSAVREAWDEIRKGLDGFDGVGDIQYVTLDNETDDYEDDTKLYRVIGDFVVQYLEQ